MKNSFRKQRGQSIIAGMFLSVLSIAGLVMMYNTSQTTTEKMQVINAVDASAYSGAVWTARQLNYMAYTNRAMIGNHVAVGHLVSYVSWIRYAEGTVAELNDYLFWVPYLGAALGYAEQYAGYALEYAEIFSEGYVPAIDTFNRILSVSQQVALINLNPATIEKVMQDTADNYGNIDINDSDLLQSFSSPVFNQGVIAYEMTQISRFTKNYNPGNDRGRIKKMVDQSLDKSEAWVKGNRGWELCFHGTCSKIPGNIKITKTGSTTQIDNASGSSNSVSGDGECSGSDSSGDGLDWYAKDKLEGKKASFKRLKFRWKTLFSRCHEASATEFYSNYRGIHDYRAIRSQTRDDYVLSISAFGASSISEARPHQFLQPVNNPRLDVKMPSSMGTEYITGIARAEIYHSPPEVKSLLRRTGEYANLYNPFWQVHLSEDRIQQAFNTVPGL